MAGPESAPVRSRKGLKLSSIHSGRRKYPAVASLDLQLPAIPLENKTASALLSPSSSADTLPEHTSPSSAKLHSRSHSSFRSLIHDFIARNDLRIPHSRALWILLWFSLNLTLTLSNKVVLNKFPFPYSVTGVHALSGCIGTWFALRPEDRLPALSPNEVVVLVSFSMLYTLNIVVSNVSLQLVTVPFHQVVRSSAPFFTLILSALLLHSRVTGMKLISLIPVVVGVGLATYGDYYYTLTGFLLTLLGTFLASLKTVVTNILQTPDSASSFTRIHQDHRSSPSDSEPRSLSQHPNILTSHGERGSSISIQFSLPPDPEDKPEPPTSFFSSVPKLRLTPIQLLHLLSPLALFQCVLLAIYFNEPSKLLSYLYTYRSPGLLDLKIFGKNPSQGIINGLNATALAAGPSIDPNASAEGLVLESILLIVIRLAPNAFLAFALNIVSFETNRKVGALGMSVAANVKQVLTILSSVGLFNLTITRMNALGILLTLIGGGWYASVDLRERRLRRHSR